MDGRIVVRTALISLVALICNPAFNAASQFSTTDVQSLGVRSEDFKPFYRAQEKWAWCWAACIEMVLDHAGVNVNQWAIVEQVYGTDWDGIPPDAPGSCEQMVYLLNQWGIDDDGDGFVVHSNGQMGVPPPAWLLGELEAGHPIIALFYPNPGQTVGHFVVITAADYHETPAGPLVTSLIIWDPFPYEDTGSTPPSYYSKSRPMTGRYAVPADAFMSQVVFHMYTRAVSDEEEEYEWPDY